MSYSSFAQAIWPLLPCVLAFFAWFLTMLFLAYGEAFRCRREAENLLEEKLGDVLNLICGRNTYSEEELSIVDLLHRMGRCLNRQAFHNRTAVISWPFMKRDVDRLHALLKAAEQKEDIDETYHFRHLRRFWIERQPLTRRLGFVGKSQLRQMLDFVIEWDSERKMRERLFGVRN